MSQIVLTLGESPIPKGYNVNEPDSANFKGIALSSIFGKIVLLSRSVNVLRSSIWIQTQNLYQFMFYCFEETIAYYVQNQKPVFCTFLDSTEAFDIIANYLSNFSNASYRYLL